MSEDKKVAFLPFHALNQFMRNDFRLGVVRAAVYALPRLPKKLRVAVDKQTRRYVRVPGFRNSIKAPPALKARHLDKIFEKNADLVAAILAAWAATKAELRQQVFDLLTGRGWELLPIEADRTKLPGFLTRWPAGEDFAAINAAFAEMYPDAEAEEDDVSLMTVWLSGRLPVEVDEAPAEEPE